MIAALIVGGVTERFDEAGTETLRVEPVRRTSAEHIPASQAATFVDFRLPAFGTMPEPAPTFDSIGQALWVDRSSYPTVFTVNTSISR